MNALGANLNTLIVGIYFLLNLALTYNTSFAATLGLSNLNLPQTDSVFRTFAADLAFRPVEPPSSARFFGLSFGVIGVLTSTEEVTAVLPDNKLKYIPGADIFIGLQAPLGLGVEIGFIPTQNISGIKLGKFGGSLKWTINQTFMEKSPFDLAARLMYTNAKISYRQNLSAGTLDLSLKDTIIGSSVSLGMPFLFGVFEPYLGLGMVKQKGILEGSGTVNLFNQSFTTKSSIQSENTSLWFYVGNQIRLLLFTLSFQYDRFFGINSFSFKAGLKI